MKKKSLIELYTCWVTAWHRLDTEHIRNSLLFTQNENETRFTYLKVPCQTLSIHCVVSGLQLKLFGKNWNNDRISDLFTNFIFYDIWAFIVCLSACWRLSCQRRCQCCQLCEWQLSIGIFSNWTLVSFCRMHNAWKIGEQSGVNNRVENTVIFGSLLNNICLHGKHTHYFLIFRGLNNCHRLKRNQIDLLLHQLIRNAWQQCLFVWSHKDENRLNRMGEIMLTKAAAISSNAATSLNLRNIRETHFKIAEQTIWSADNKLRTKYT